MGRRTAFRGADLLSMLCYELVALNFWLYGSSSWITIRAEWPEQRSSRKWEDIYTIIRHSTKKECQSNEQEQLALKEPSVLTLFGHMSADETEIDRSQFMFSATGAFKSHWCLCLNPSVGFIDNLLFKWPSRKAFFISKQRFVFACHSLLPA